MTPHFRNHYQALSLPHPPHNPELDIATIRKAYHTALLRYHPDKLRDIGNDALTVAVDEIVQAYATLSSPVRRRKYDAELLDHDAEEIRAARIHAQAESIDLDEFDEGYLCVAHMLDDYKESERCHGKTNDDCLIQHVWYCGCRCGRKDAYILSDAMLEDAAGDIADSDGEVLVQCLRCSTWIRVLFTAV
ncbi:hypothetical protein POJ06DRAFT_116928 [Lipomyces tetrasporus]|uniref:Diphthamide biosynthesis protein 4 n=1 Tax=Lipomyces tetrasporus TaxID=54092 RepID=A0AAD7QR07_9ASCO|nr:uncharacterized protein POJ06DRAFT_116928 [Lipomyces tetrasporus]KAJ8099800.1 hypothetical protein POJ06DRAFT_116928 [Lipomyces tetrasporus]